MGVSKCEPPTGKLLWKLINWTEIESVSPNNFLFLLILTHTHTHIFKKKSHTNFHTDKQTPLIIILDQCKITQIVFFFTEWIQF